MELIDKNKIEEAAKIIAKNTVDYGGDLEQEMGVKCATKGAQFAQNELIPLFCEFAEWCLTETRRDYVNSKHAYIYKGEPKTTQQLFELWMESRNKQ